MSLSDYTGTKKTFMPRVIHILAATVMVVLVSVLYIASIGEDSVSAARKEDWNSTNIMSDAIFTDNNSMSTEAIQVFLDSRINCDINGSGIAVEYQSPLTRAQYAASQGWAGPPYTCLNKYYEVPKTSPGGALPANNYSNPTSIPSGAQSAAWIIKDAADRYGISPKVLLVKIATESAGPLTYDNWPLFSQYRYAMGARCPDSGPGGSANCDPAYAGFSIQMYEAAALMRSYLNNMNEPWWQYKRVGSGKVFADGTNSNYVGWNVAPRGCGGTVLNIETKATAALYTYTPYQPNHAALDNMYGTGDNCSAYGNRNFWRVYWDWFGDTRHSEPYRWSLRSITLYSDTARTNIVSNDGRATLQPGQTAYATVRAENTGTSVWNNSMILETTNHSVIRGDDWTAYNKTSPAKEGDVPTGSVGTFNFSIKSPTTPGLYTQHLNLHHNESGTWLNNNELSIQINSIEALPMPEITDLNRLKPGEVMKDGDMKYSPERHTVFRLYNGEIQLFVNFQKVWSSGTAGNKDAKLVNQGDGNLVLYAKTGQALWASNTDIGSPSTISIQTDANVVSYNNGNPIWSTNTSAGNQLAQVNTSVRPGGVLYPGQRLSTRDRKTNLVFQGDGNLVLYDFQGKPLWASNTDGKDASFLSLQGDGNLVIYSTQGKPLWASNTDRRNASPVLVLQEDKNVVLYDNSRATWASNTAGK